MKILAFTGMPFSGKTEAVKIANDMGFPVVRMGDAVWDEVTSRGLGLTDENVGSVADSMRQEFGMDIWARRTVNKIRSMGKQNCVVIDGIRNVEEIDVFKRELGKDFVVVAVNASVETRRKRALLRGREDDSRDLSDVEERDHRELRWGMGAVMASADVVVSNEDDLKEFRRRIRDLLSKFR